MPLALLLKVAVASCALPEIVPELLTVMPPLLSAMATLEAVFASRLAVTVPVLVNVALCVLPLLIWIAGCVAEPSDATESELLTETTPLTPLRIPVPVCA